MANKGKKKRLPFETIAIRCEAASNETSIFSVNDKIGIWVSPYDDTLTWVEFTVYGLLDSEDEQEKAQENDFSSTTQIGKISGYHIPLSLIINLHGDLYAVCDSANADLEAMISVIQEFEDIFEDFGFYDDMFYIHEIELLSDYQNLGYEKNLLLQLPAIITKALRVFPSLLMYYPRQIQYDEPESDVEAEAILLHRLEYNTRESMDSKKSDNVTYFPPVREIPEKEINRVLGRRNPGTTVHNSHRNHRLYNLYEAVGFKEAGNSGWLYKIITDIYS
jgi:ribosomal protein S18 acetylase RimI-like enzyme